MLSRGTSYVYCSLDNFNTMTTATVAQSVKRPELRSFKERAGTELKRVQFPVESLEVGKNPSRSICEVSMKGSRW